ncbi:MULTISPECIES: ECF transporter S component [Streptococcus]|uniref:ECF transporter S component n=1 Tax=Streptococcus ruminantium TaxID=1917441 RepID=A0A2Z5TN91_9STRE|nr:MULTISPECIES: ECF transporter S component [Streptococcus]QHF54850.1 pantothenic acid transporter pant [Streptococcus sp. DAT741]BBA92746.1 ECF transporter S component [Streptococcus ruminantium]
MKNNKSNFVATIAIFFAVMLVVHLSSSIIFNLLPFPIKPTLIHIPVIIASILYGPRIGATLGGLMGMISVVTNTVILLPTSYLFTPFVPNGNILSLIIAIVPRILIGITPYFVHQFIKNKLGLLIAGAIGSMTNTVFVLGGIFVFFSSVYNANIQLMLAGIIGTNAIAEMVISSILALIIVPRILKLKNQHTS